MYCSSTEPVPTNEYGRNSFQELDASRARKLRMFAAVNFAASRYACAGTIPPDAFPDFGLKPKTQVPIQGPFDTPMWGDYDAQWPGICTPGSSFLNWLQQNPWWALGLAAVALAGGVIGTGMKRRRRAR